MKYKLEIVKSMTSTPQIYELSISLDEILEMCRNRYKSNISIYLTDSQDNEIAYRELGVWTICQ